MSEGTMQRRAQRDQRARPELGAATPSRTPALTRRSRALVGAFAVPAMLLAAGCSSESGSDPDSAKAASQGTSASPSPTVRAAVYGALPEACSVVPEKTLEDLVPEGDSSGKEGSSNDTAYRASCSWDSLDDKGVDGSQFRWLNVSLLRFDSDIARGPGDELAQEYYDKQVEDAQSVDGAEKTETEALSDLGDVATAIGYDLEKDEGDFTQRTVVARAENVVVTVDYNGAGLAGGATPDADDLTKGARQAAEDAVAAVAAAGEKDSDAKDTDEKESSPSASAETSASPSASPSEEG
ncbi:DUF3558 domain-containing protein [Streptomyces sp. ZYX-F-203]